MFLDHLKTIGPNTISDATMAINDVFMDAPQNTYEIIKAATPMATFTA